MAEDLPMAGAAAGPTCVHCGVEVGTEFLCWNCNRNTRHFTETTEPEMYDEYRELVLKQEEKVWRVNFLFAVGAIGVLVAFAALALLLRWSGFYVGMPLLATLVFIRPAWKASRRLHNVRKALAGKALPAS